MSENRTYKAVFIFDVYYNGYESKLNASRVESLKEHFDKVYGAGNYLFIDGHTEDIHLNALAERISNVDEYTKFFIMAPGGYVKRGDMHIFCNFYPTHVVMNYEILPVTAASTSYTAIIEGKKYEFATEKALNAKLFEYLNGQQNTIEYVNGLRDIFSAQNPGKTMDLTILSCSAHSIIPYLDTTNLHLTTYGEEIKGVWRKECVQTLRKIVEFDAKYHSTHTATIGAIIHSHEEINVATNGHHIRIKPYSEQHKESIYHDIRGDIVKYQEFINSSATVKMDSDFSHIILPEKEDPMDILHFYFRKKDEFMMLKALTTTEISSLQNADPSIKHLLDYYASKILCLWSGLWSGFMIQVEDNDEKEDDEEDDEDDNLMFYEFYKKNLSFDKFINSDFFLTAIASIPFIPSQSEAIFNASTNQERFDIFLDLMQLILLLKSDSKEFMTAEVLIKRYLTELANISHTRDIDHINALYNALQNEDFIQSDYFAKSLFQVATKHPTQLKVFIDMWHSDASRSEIAAVAIKTLEDSYDYSNEYKYASDVEYNYLSYYGALSFYTDPKTYDMMKLIELLSLKDAAKYISMLEDKSQLNLAVRDLFTDEGLRCIRQKLQNEEKLDQFLTPSFIQSKFFFLSVLGGVKEYVHLDDIFSTCSPEHAKQSFINYFKSTLGLGVSDVTPEQIASIANYNADCDAALDAMIGAQEYEIHAIHEMMQSEEFISGPYFTPAVVRFFKEDIVLLEKIAEIRAAHGSKQEVADLIVESLKHSNDFTNDFMYG